MPLLRVGDSKQTEKTAIRLGGKQTKQNKKQNKQQNNFDSHLSERASASNIYKVLKSL